MESLNLDLKQKTRSMADQSQRTRSQLRSVQQDLRTYQQREANLLNLLLTGLEEPLDIIERHVDELFTGQHPHRNRDAADIKLGRVRNEVHRLRKIVTDLMASSAVHLGKAPLRQEQVDVKELVDRVLEEHHQTAVGQQVDLSKKFAEPLPPVLGDRQQLHLALDHLVDNAIAHSPLGGRVIIEANGKQSRDRVSVSVSDMRRDAIDGGMLRFLWNPSPGRNGQEKGIRGFDLELTAAAHIIDLLNGRIDVTSRPGKETIFTMTLPSGSALERMR
jgi:signal transduction histidine kinase